MSRRVFSILGVVIGLSTGCPDDTPPLCVYDGQGLQLGEVVSAGDDCNDCTCLSTGEMDCTERACAPTDPPVPPDAGPSPQPDAGSPNADAGVTRPPSDCVDSDEDGFYTCLDENYPEWPQVVDCDDRKWFVQPGGYEFPDNEIDDDCNGTRDDVPTCTCTGIGATATAQDLVSAMDLCDSTLGDVQTVGHESQAAVFTSLYDSIDPRSGDCLAVLSTGEAGGTDLQGTGLDTLNSCAFSDPLPDGESAEICDLAQLKVTLHPPRNALGIEFSFMFLSSEWPEWLCYDYNDTFHTLLSSEAVNGGEEANISFDSQQRQITVNVGFFEQPRDWTVPLDDTPLGAADFATCPSFTLNDACVLPEYCDEDVNLSFVGSGSGWLQTRAPIVPGEESVELVFSIHDEGDGNYDSIVILDDLKWLPYRPPVSTTKD